MKKCFLLLFLLPFVAKAQVLDSASLAQQTLFFSFEQTDTIACEKVYRLKFKRKLPNDFSQKILNFPNLQQLILSGVNLKEIPEQIFELQNLTYLDLSNNRLKELPAKIGKLSQLQQLIINRNNIAELPKEIKNLTNLKYLDMWSTLIITLPQEISALDNNLKTIDLRVINMHDSHKKAMQELLPNVKILFSPSCDCNIK